MESEKQSTSIPIPPEVQEIFDEASIEGGNLSAAITHNSVKLVVTGGDETLKEVSWPDAGRFMDEWLKNLMASGALNVKKEPNS